MSLSGCGYYAQLKRGSFKHSGDVQEIDLNIKKRLLFVEVMINGKKKRFIIDSGAPNLIDQKLQDEFGFKKLGSIGVNDVGGRTKNMIYVKVPELKMGGITVKNTVAIVGDFSKFTCFGIDGIIGTNVMSHFDWKLDYSSKKAFLYPDPILQEELEKFLGPIEMLPNRQNSPYVEMAFQGGESKRTLIDLGSAGSISIRKWEGFSSSGFLESGWIIGESSIGMHGSISDTAEYVYLNQISFDGIDAGPSMGKVTNSSDYSIGNGFLANFEVIMSWSAKAMYLRPVGEPLIQLPEKTLYLGYKEGGAYLKAFSSGLDLNKAEIGDRIDQLNSNRMQGITEEEFCEIMDQPLENVKVSVLGSPEDVIYMLEAPQVKY